MCLVKERFMEIRLGVLVFVILCGVLIGTLPLFGQEGVTALDDKNNLVLEEQVKHLEEEINDLKRQLKKVENIDKLDLLAKYARARTEQAKALTEQAKAVNELIDTDRKHLVNQSKSDISFWMFTVIGPLLGVAALITTVAALFGIPKVLRDMVEKELVKRIDGFKEKVSQVDKHVEEIKVIRWDLDRSILISPIIDVGQIDRISEKKLKLISAKRAIEFFHSNDESDSVRQDALEVFAAHGDNELYISLFVGAVKDKCEGIGFFAVEVLMKTVTDSCLLKVLEECLTNENKNVRYVGLTSLEDLGTPEAKEIVRKHKESETSV